MYIYLYSTQFHVTLFNFLICTNSESTKLG